MPDRPQSLLGPRNPGLTPMMLNHAAWVTHDVAATADFYTRVMGMELASTIFDDRVPSTGDAFPYFHVFFRMQDGSTLAFFEAPGLPLPAKSTHPAYDIFNHIVLAMTGFWGQRAPAQRVFLDPPRGRCTTQPYQPSPR